jgi:hypothetical protein
MAGPAILVGYTETFEYCEKIKYEIANLLAMAQI